MRLLRKLPLRTRALFLGLAGLLAVLGLAGYLSTRALRENTERILAERMLLAEQLATHVDHHLEETFALLEETSQREGFDLGDASLEPERHALQNLYQSGVFSCHVFIADGDGVVLLTEPHIPEKIGEDLSGQAYITSALQTGLSQVSDLLVCPEPLATTNIAFVFPVESPSGEVVGLLGGVTDPNSQVFANIVGDLPVLGQHHADLLDRNGMVLASTNPQYVLKESRHRLCLLPSLRDRRAGINTCVDENDQEEKIKEVVALTPLSNAPWSLSIEQPETEVLASVHELRERLILVAVLSSLVAVGFVVLNSRATVAPIRQLRDAAQRISSGDLNTPVTVTGKDEIATLEASLERMRQQLASHREQLEKEVVSRTQHERLLARYLRVLNQAVARATVGLEIERVIETIVETLVAECEAAFARIWLVDESGEYLILRASAGKYTRLDGSRARIPISDYPYKLGLIARQRKPLISNQVQEEAQHFEVDWARSTGMVAFAGYPIVAEDKLLGVIALFSQQPISPELLDVLGAFVNQMGIALANASMFAESQRRLAELSAVFEVSTALRGAETVSEILSIILEETLEVVGSDSGAFFIWKADEELFEVQNARGQLSQLTGMMLGPSEGVCGHVAQTGQPYIFDDLANDPHTGESLKASVAGVGAGVCVPLIAGDRLVGVLTVGSASTQPFAENQVDILSAIANIAAAAVHRASLFEQLEYRTHELSSLFEIGQMVTASLRLEEDVLDLVVESARKSLRAEGSWLHLWDERKERLVLQAVRGFPADLVGSFSYRLGESLTGWVFLESKVVNIPDLASDPRWKRDPEYEGALASGAAKNALVVPLLVGSKNLGVLGVANKIGGSAFTNDDQLLLTALAGQVAIAIENARLYEDVRDLSVAAIRSLAAAIDARDPYTRGHSQGVTDLVIQLGKKMGWNGPDLDLLEFAALLHDVGKIAVPDAVLRKVEPLTPDEWSIIRMHPYHSAQIIKPVEPLERIIPWVYHHHERWDGTGYPDGLGGEDIPLASRIIAVADSYNAMTTDRPYRKALSQEEALAEIERCAGSQFDPQVAEFFLNIRFLDT